MIIKKRQIALMIAPDASFTRGVLRGIRDFARKQGHWTLFHGPFRRGIPTAAALQNWVGDGIIGRPEHAKDAEILKSKGIPVVVVAAGSQIAGAPTVRTDDEAIAKLAAEHLLERRFSLLGFCGDDRFPASQRRQEAFAKSAAAAGVPCYCFNPKLKDPTGNLPQEELVAWLQSLPRPIGVLGAWDGHAGQLLEACMMAEIAVPQEVAILGVDNDDLICHLSEIPLSSVMTDPRAIGYRAAEILDGLLEGRPAPQDVELIGPLGIAVRQSTNVLAVDDELVRETLRLVQTEACHGITVNSIVHKLAVSRRTLESRFLKVLGQTPHQMIRQARLTRAKELLADTNLLLVDIARLAGFSQVSALVVSFREAFQQTPGGLAGGPSQADSGSAVNGEICQLDLRCWSLSSKVSRD